MLSEHLIHMIQVIDFKEPTDQTSIRTLLFCHKSYQHNSQRPRNWYVCITLHISQQFWKKKLTKHGRMSEIIAAKKHSYRFKIILFDPSPTSGRLSFLQKEVSGVSGQVFLWKWIHFISELMSCFHYCL